MIVFTYLCNTHGRQVTKMADGSVARCPVCGAPMFRASDSREQRPDPRAQRPPRGEGKPL